MPRLPQPGSDDGTWGAILNDYLLTAHAADGTLKPGIVTPSAIADTSITPGKLNATTPTSGQVLSYSGTGFEWVTNPAGVTDHGLLSGLTDDDHTQYHTDARGDARYYTQAQINTSLSGKANTSHTHAIADVTNLQTTLDGKAASSHAHVIADTTGLQAALDAKAAASHTHAAADIASGVLATARLGTGTADNTTFLRGDGTWAAPPGGGGATWGSVTGTLSSQTDLQSALDAKAATSHTHAQADITNLTNDLAAKEPTVAVGTSAQYYRGDKTWQTLDKTAVGLANVDNTSDASKPISTATQTALDGKAASSHAHVTNDVTGLDTTLQKKIEVVTDAAGARPTGVDVIIWKCSTEPTNWTTADIWIQTP